MDATEGLPEGFLCEGDYVAAGEVLVGGASLGVFERIVWRKSGKEYVKAVTIYAIEGSEIFDFYLKKDAALSAFRDYKERSDKSVAALKLAVVDDDHPLWKIPGKAVAKIFRQAVDLPKPLPPEPTPLTTKPAGSEPSFRPPTR